VFIRPVDLDAFYTACGGVTKVRLAVTCDRMRGFQLAKWSWGNTSDLKRFAILNKFNLKIIAKQKTIFFRKWKDLNKMNITGFEIDFLPVGEKSASGDAILFRCIDDNGVYTVILIDGGYAETGKKSLIT
jgi:hypothetical protein